MVSKWKMTATLMATALLMSACGIKGDLVRPSEINQAEENKKQ